MTSIVFPPGKFFCYLRQPKSASLSMTKWMIDFAKQNKKPYLTSLHYQQKNFNVDYEKNTIITHHMTAQRLKNTIPQWWNDMEKMVTVRNPWNILASKFYHMKKLGVNQVATNTFEEFCHELKKLRGTLNPGENYYNIGEDINADHIIPIENLQEYLNEIFKDFIVPKVQHTNIGTVTQEKYKNLYTDEINNMIEIDFKYEIKLFDYKF